MESGRIATLSRNEILEKGDLHVANLVGVTNPVPNYDASNNNRTLPAAPKPSDTRIQNIPDPSRVGRPDARTDQQGANDALNSGVLRYDSNLQFFLQQMRDMPELGAELSKMVTLMQGLVTTPGLAAGVTEELSGFLELLKMDPDAFRQFFQTQMEAGNRFAGPLFSLLREVYQKTPGDTVRGAILNFAKRYSDFSATGHIGRSMLSLLRQLSDYLPQSWRGQLAELTGKLENGLQAGARAENLELLQGQILPYLGSYIKRYHDMGTARTLLGMLMLHMARYENGAEEGVMLAFRQLGGYGDTLAGLNQFDDQTLWKLLRENQFTKAAQADTFTEQLARTAQRALQGEYGTDLREAFQEIVRSMLLNESVFLPLHHTIVPLEWEGRRMYSELWVDPDAEEREEARDGRGDGHKIQFLFKMDLPSVGFLEMTLGAGKEQVDVSVYGPDSVTAHSSLIAEDLGQILADHGLKGRSVQVQKHTRPLTLTEVFPGLFEGERGINVKI